MNPFDLVADRFERDRALPPHVPIAMREALELHGAINAGARLLEIGCGTGRIGAQFHALGDNYFGVDLSMPMLGEFRRKEFARSPNLVQADGRLLPFADGVFNAVMMVHVLTARHWRALLVEAQRVLRSGGILMIGRAEGPPDSIDARMRNRLDELIAALGISEPSRDRGAMTEWLRARSSRHLAIRTARWNVDRIPREFLLRKQSAARFALLPPDVRESALRSLAEWTKQSIGPLDSPVSQAYHFRLDLYWI